VVDHCKTDLEQLYPPVQASADVEELQHCGTVLSDQRINIVMLTGDSVSLPFNPAMTVERLKAEIKKRFGVEEDKQQLMYSDRVLEVQVVNSMFTYSSFILVNQECSYTEGSNFVPSK